MSDLPVVFLMGPTAIGKTAVAVELVQRMPLEIISVDSALIYRGMDVGTAKPDQATLSIAPHHLIDICEPTEIYSAAQFRHDALQAIREIHSENKIPLLVGGGMLYFRALEEGLSELPKANPEVRKQLDQEAEALGWAAMHKRLQHIDPESAERIHPNDPQRIQRALEVYEITGYPISQLQRQELTAPLNYPLLKLILTTESRTKLHGRIEQRFDEMLRTGLVEEVRRLKKVDGMHLGLPSARAVGYRQVWEHVDGQCDSAEMRKRGIVATRRYAKRQMTWLRKQKNAKVFDAFDDNTIENVTYCVQQFIA